MKNTINASIQIVPVGIAGPEAYSRIDKAIKIIEDSGLRYRVGPLDTVVEGDYSRVMETFRQAQEACLSSSDSEIVVTIKLHRHGSRDIHFEDKVKDF